MTAKTLTHTAEVLASKTPNGETAVKITCLCMVCNGKSAVVRKTYADEHKLTVSTKAAYTHIHNLVGMAHSPLRNAPQVKANGPWAA
jgi:hypothetical protein